MIDKQAEVADVCQETIKEMDAKATVEEAVAIAAPPKEVEEVIFNIVFFSTNLL